MFSENMQTVRALLDAIKADWALVDDSDDDDFYLLVNEDRDEHPTLKPGKALVRSLEDDGYLEFDEARSDARGQAREFMEMFGEPEPVPWVFFFRVTGKGQSLP